MHSPESFMQQAVALSRENIARGGGPFGAVVVRDGAVVGAGANRVTAENDPTAHAEVKAIREACKRLGTFDLSGCTLYTSCEPCPMCLSAAYWARIDAIFYANTRDDAQAIGFDDAFLYEELARPLAKRRMPMRQLLRDRALETFRAWEELPDKISY